MFLSYYILFNIDSSLALSLATPLKLGGFVTSAYASATILGHFGSSTLGFAQTSGHALIITLSSSTSPLIFWCFASSAHKSSLLGVGFALDT